MSSITRQRPDPGRRAPSDAEILAATQRLLSDGASFTELGVQQVSAAAGVSRTTFYAHFRDKADLLMQLAATTVATAFSITSAWEPADGAEGLADTFLQVLGIWREHAAVIRAVAEVAAYDEAVRDFWRQKLSPFSDRTIAVLREEQQAGRTPASVDLASATRVIVIGGERAIFDHVTAADPGDDATFARELALIWWHGVYRRAAPPAC